MKKKKNKRENSSQEEEEEVIVSIQDTGIGIDPNVKNKLFKKFAIKSEQGMGLGLYISRSIIEAHGGKIWAENNPNGKGATFSFSLPFTNLLVSKPSS